MALLREAALPCESVSLSPSMDLLASPLTDGKLCVYRTISWQRVFTLAAEDLGGHLSSLAWSPDGKTLACGTAEGGVSLYAVETGAVEKPEQSLHPGFKVCCLGWFQQQGLPDRSAWDLHLDEIAEVEGTYRESVKNILGGFPTTKEEGHEEELSFVPNPRKEEQDGLDVLVSADASGVLAMCVHGTYHGLSLDIGSYVGETVQPLHLMLSADLQLVSLLVQAKGGSVELLQLRVPHIWERRHHLKPLALHAGMLSMLVDSLESTVGQAEKQWTKALQPLQVKVGLLSSLLRDYGCSSSPRTELLNLVTCGYASPAVAQFLANNLTEVHLTRLQKGLDGAIRQLENLLRGDLLRTVHTLLLIAGDARMLAHARAADIACGESEDQQGSHLPDSSASLLQQHCQTMCARGEHLLRELQVAHVRLVALFQWLLSIVPNYASENAQVQEGTPAASRHLIDSVLTFLSTAGVDDVVEVTIAGTNREVQSVESILGTRVAGFFVKAPPRAKKVSVEPPAWRITAVRSLAGALPKGVSEATLPELTAAVKAQCQGAPSLPSRGGILQAGITVHFRMGVSGAAVKPSEDEMRRAADRSAMKYREQLGDLMGAWLLASLVDSALWLFAIVPGPESWQEMHAVAIDLREFEGGKPLQVLFYGRLPGQSFTGAEQVMVLLDSTEGLACQICSLPYDELPFTCIGKVPHHAAGGPNERSALELAQQAGLTPASTEALGTPMQCTALPEGLQQPRMAVSGPRGTACVYSANHHLVIYDFEAEADDDDDDDDNELLADADADAE